MNANTQTNVLEVTLYKCLNERYFAMNSINNLVFYRDKSALIILRVVLLFWIFAILHAGYIT